MKKIDKSPTAYFVRSIVILKARPADATTLKNNISLFVLRVDRFVKRGSPARKNETKHQSTFKQLKARLASSTIFASSAFDQPFTSHTDASGIGAGAALTQVL